MNSNRNKNDIIKSIVGFKIKGKRIIPISTKITLIFIVIILVSNFSSNYVNLILNRIAIIKLAQSMMIKDLTELYNISSTQYDILELNLAASTTQTNEFRERALRNIEIASMDNTQSQTAVALGIDKNGKIIFMGTKTKIPNKFSDIESLNAMKKKPQGIINFKYNNREYLGVYKYSPRWSLYLMRADQLETFYKESNAIFKTLSIVIFAFTLITMLIGVLALRYTLRYIRIYTSSLMKMHKAQVMGQLDLRNAPSDDVTLLGVTFNVFSATIANLIDIFKKFVSKDVAYKAYVEKQVKLEGEQQELTMLFSDIKSFTFITEILGNDIIKLLNVHYDKAIEEISKNDGIIGSIIGDALLAVYGTIKKDNNNINKSFQAVQSAYAIQKAALGLRKEMAIRRLELADSRGNITEDEENVFKSVSIEVGVGIDGGSVFYGNIGSYERMTNTVIGDNVNNAARLEGLTRLYKIPVICSEYVKEDIESSADETKNLYAFLEIDTVQVKGKTVGRKIYWPIPIKATEKNKLDFYNYTKGLYYYYAGEWNKTRDYLGECKIHPAKVILERIENAQSPKGWNGIWVMKEK